MELLGENLKYLRLRKRLSQNKLGGLIQINASTIGSYENNRSTPKIKNLDKLSKYFKKTLDELIYTSLEIQDKEKIKDTKGANLRILPIIVDHSNEEMISLVPIKAAAGYLSGFSDTEFISELPSFRLPFSELSENKTYRAFQIEGDSMLPIPSGAYIICEYTQDWEQINNGSCNVIITNDDGIVYKRVQKDIRNNQFILHSDNIEYASFEISINNVLEVWKALGYVSFIIP